MAPSRSCTLARGDDDAEEQPERIDEDMALAPLDLFARIKAADPPFSVVLTDWLSMMPALGCRCLPGRHPYVAAEPVVHHLPGPILLPAPKILVDDLPGGEVMGQQAPRTATTQDIKDAVQDFAFGVLLWAAPRLGARAHRVGSTAHSWSVRSVG